MQQPQRPLAARSTHGKSACVVTLAGLVVASLALPASQAWAAAPASIAPTAEDPGASARSPVASKAWDVDKRRGPTTEARIDVREGTWMSVTVHPDGKKVVFDLLGDLYELPIAGGEAKALTHGAAWDMQPTYSPDGRWLAFTSDRGGGDNIWIMPAAGGEPKAVSEEKFRLLNSPAWSADSRFIVARKHFTSERSLGAGELWLFHRGGGAGVQMTKRPNDQKDIGEPALSPDGRWLYYSRDATPGKVFQYNKDPNQTIFSIFRLDRRTGQTERLLSGPGGAIRPTPSPDGKWIAYIRRIRGKTVLLARDLRSGEERRLWDGLDRDLQETWSVHGVYPAMSWHPDSRTLALWAGGQLWHVGVDGKRAPLPFHVKTTRTVHQALRYPVKVGAPTVHLRAIRWPTLSPDGSKVVFEAVGRLWVKDVAGGKPRRLTQQGREQELTPAWSRDGKHIVYATWDDDRLGAVRMIAAKGGKQGRALTPEPGHYRSPAFSPDGRVVAFQKMRGGWLRSARWSRDPGLYAVSVSGGAMHRFSRTGDSPHFATASDRVFFHTFDAKAKAHQLTSVGLGDRRARVHASSKFGDELRISPDGKWLAFREGYEAWVVPFAFTGLPITLKPKGRGLPTVRASESGGSFLTWAADSRSLLWSTGPILSQLQLKRAFAWLGGDKLAAIQARSAGPIPAQGAAPPPKPARPKAIEIDLGFELPAVQPTGTFALVGVRILTMASAGGSGGSAGGLGLRKDGGLIEDGVIVWRGDRIVAVGPRTSVTIPANAQRIEGGGKTVIPGLIDVHAHGAQGSGGIIPRRNWGSHSLLSFGVTTVHDPSNHTETVFAASEQQKVGRILGPRLFSTGSILYGATAVWTAKIDSQADAKRHLSRLKAIGAFSVKSYNQPRREQRQQILAAARELKMMVVPEGGALFMHNMTQVVDGHTGVEHALPLAKLYADVVQLWSQTHVGHTPTLGVAYGGLGGENYWYAKTHVDQHRRLNRFVPPWAIDPRARRPRTAHDGAWNHIQAARFAKQLVDAGGHVQLGAHGQREGLAAHWELWSFVQGGMTPVQALRAGTLDGARYLGLDGDIGSLEAGKLADFVVIDGKPDQQIRSSERVSKVVLGGRVFDAQTLQPIVPKGPAPAPWFWQQAGHPSHGPASGHAHGGGCGCGRN